MEKNFDWIIYKLFFDWRNPVNERQCWFGHTALNWLHKIDITNFRVLEFGGGGSTLYFSDNAESVDTVEQSEMWIDLLKSKLFKDNVNFIDVPSGKYDLIIVDSKTSIVDLRVKEFELAKKLIKKNGFIMFDNINYYPDCLKEMDFVLKGFATNTAGITYTGVKRG